MKLMSAYTANTESDEKDSLKFMVWPDSAIIRSGKPLFLPSEGIFYIHPAVGAMISAVGKSIGTKFAPRYYREVTALAFLLPEKVSDQLEEGADPKACDIVADYSVILGNPVNATEFAGPLTLLSKRLNPAEGEAFEETIFSDGSLLNLDRAISLASERNTLKTGDVVAVISGPGIRAERNSLLKLTGNHNDILIENKLK